jgi:ubiquinone/menaquinone biosynthesis C-methylase UbiE
MLRYDCINSHLRMIWDELRCHSYAAAISRAIKPGDIVIDFGCGLGIWSMIAAKAGASRVYAIEAVDDMTHMAQALIAENNLGDRITTIHANAASVDLPEKADCLISELMNGAGFNEYDGEPLMKVRDRFLKPGGRMIPQRIRHVIRLCHLQTEFKSDNGDWADGMYGLTWNAVKDFASASSTVTELRNYAWASSPHVWWDLDLMRDDLSDNQYRAGIPAHWEIQTASRVHGVAAYFEADLDENIMLSTSPDAPFTHWMHTFLSFPRALEVRAGDRISVKISFSTGRGAPTYPMSVIWTRDGNILDQFDTYPTAIPGSPPLSAESAGTRQETSR